MAINSLVTRLKNTGGGYEIPCMSDDDNACIEEIVEVLKKYKRLDKFGLTLLHQHFDLDDNEVLAETNNPVCRTLLIEPMDKADLTRWQYYETAWRFNAGESVTTCVCLTDPATQY